MRWLAWILLGFLGCGAFAGPGRACRKHEECNDLERGYCSRAELCTRECSETDICPENSTCSTQGRRNVCLPSCESDADCLSNFACSSGVCVVKNPLDPPPQR